MRPTPQLSFKTLGGGVQPGVGGGGVGGVQPGARGGGGWVRVTVTELVEPVLVL